MNQANESLRASVSFVVENKSEEQKRLAFLAGHYDTLKAVVKDDKCYILRNDASALVAAGYQCDEVADDYNSNVDDQFTFKVLAKSPRSRMVDVNNYVKNTNQRVVKIRITDLSGDPTHELFNHEIEISGSEVSAKGSSDYIQMSTFVNPRNFQQNVIEIDLEDDKLLLDETTVMIMNVVGKGKFQIDYILD